MGWIFDELEERAREHEILAHITREEGGGVRELTKKREERRWWRVTAARGGSRRVLRKQTRERERVKVAHKNKRGGKESHLELTREREGGRTSCAGVVGGLTGAPGSFDRRECIYCFCGF